MLDIGYFKRRQQLIELRFNPYHDPSNGRFCSGGGGNSGKAIDKSAENSYNDSGEDAISITKASINAVKKPEIFDDDEMNKNVQVLCQRLLTETANDPPNTERAYSISLENLKGDIENVVRSKGADGEGAVQIKSLNEPYLSIHNHPSGKTMSLKDVREFLFDYRVKCIVVVGNNGNVYFLKKAPNADTSSALPKVQAYIKGRITAKSDNEFMKGLSEYGIDYKEYT